MSLDYKKKRLWGCWRSIEKKEHFNVALTKPSICVKRALF
uniref:Uncharacterized protein n=1 Tax=Anguilla anguilla TaxID=7936 RepID=A0A0E9V422_ANGAN